MICFGGHLPPLWHSRVKPRLCSLLHTSWDPPTHSSGPRTKFNSRGDTVHSVTPVFGVGCEVQDSLLLGRDEAFRMDRTNSNTSACPEPVGKRWSALSPQTSNVLLQPDTQSKPRRSHEEQNTTEARIASTFHLL